MGSRRASSVRALAARRKRKSSPTGSQTPARHQQHTGLVTLCVVVQVPTATGSALCRSESAKTPTNRAVRCPPSWADDAANPPHQPSSSRVRLRVQNGRVGKFVAMVALQTSHSSPANSAWIEPGYRTVWDRDLGDGGWLVCMGLDFAAWRDQEGLKIWVKYLVFAPAGCY
jgi:hypothetical protein